jgi:Trypsin-like peptidase domain
MVNHPNGGQKIHAILCTSTGGRGFIVAGRRHRYVITAAHCLPHLPPACSFSDLQERTYAKLLGPLGSRQQKVWAECLFVDPVADIAVLGTPDTQELPDEADAYDKLVAHRPFVVGDVLVPGEKEPVRLLSLDERWFDCTATHVGGPFYIEDAAECIVGGMSGSPIINSKDEAIGVVCCKGPDPRLATHLPGWLLHELGDPLQRALAKGMIASQASFVAARLQKI